MKAKVYIDKNNIIDVVSDELFGSFIEHVGRSVYNGIYEPTHFTADENGFRQDVISCVKEMNVSCVRYPGGNFVSAYDWKDGIGDINTRPVRLSLAWKELEPNKVGVDEMMKWAKKSNCEVIMAVNMGTGTPKDAAELVEYCNFPCGSFWSSKRIEHGSINPYNIKYWCVGNEMDGGYQIGALTAEDYSKKANEAAKQMRIIDENIELIMCGSSAPWSPTFPEWDLTVLRNSYNNMDYLSVHAYYDYVGNNDISDFLAAPKAFEKHILKVRNICDQVKEELKSDKNIKLAVDEWNVWHTAVGEKHETPWSTGEALIENHYDLADALVVGGMLSVLINNCDRVKIGCIAQLVNVIAPILTKVNGEVLKQTTYYAVKMLSECKGMKALVHDLYVENYLSPTHGETPYVFSSVCYCEKKGGYVGYFVNISNEECEIETTFNEIVSVEDHVVLTAELSDKNTFEKPNTVIPVSNKYSTKNSKNIMVKLPKYSINKIIFTGA